MKQREIGACVCWLLLSAGCGADAASSGYGGSDDEDEERESESSSATSRDAGKWRDAGATVRDAGWRDAGWDDDPGSDEEEEEDESDAGDGGDEPDEDDAGCDESAFATAKLLSARCSSCHANGTSQGGFGGVLNPAAMISSGRVKPGDPDNSPVYKRVKSGSMPFGGPPLASTEVATIGAWIECGAPAFADAGTASDAGASRDGGTVRDAGSSAADGGSTRDAGRGR